jgi:L-lactate dehydrogenase (cytochrome)
MSNIASCQNMKDLRQLARRRLPAPFFHYLEGGSDDEWTLRRNTSAFDDYQLMPNYLRDVSSINLRTRVLGLDLELPVILAPTGGTRMFHHHKDLGVARAAEKYGALYTLSTMGTTTLEDVAAATAAPKMFQVYVFRDRELTREFLQRCKDAHYNALCLTVDTAVAGNRERDLVHGLTLPPRPNLRSAWGFATRPAWCWHYLLQPDLRFANVEHRVKSGAGGSSSIMQYVNEQFDPSLTWKDVEWLRQQWEGPLVIKGIQSVGDARMARDAGADAVMISNHGGRQLDGAPAPIDSLRPIRDALGSDLELIVDGGVRRATHVLKALALGADAVSIGRPYLYGLAAGGQAGVERVLEIFKCELERNMALLGCRAITELGDQHISKC